MMATPAAGFRQPTIRPSVSHDDDSSRSPEPSPVGPPPPQEYPRGGWSAARHWTPARPDDDSLLSVPNAPSPYSPPPASLFSGEEWAPKSVRKTRPPVREIHTRVEPAPTPPATTGRMMRPPATDRSTLGPAIRQLTEQLEKGKQAFYLLQEENKALVHENQEYRRKLEEICSLTASQQERMRETEATLQEQMNRWTEANRELSAEKESWQKHEQELQEKLAKLQEDLLSERNNSTRVTTERDTLEQSHNSILEEKTRLVHELEKARERASQSESHHTVLLEKMDSLQSEIRTAESAKQVEQRLQSATERLELELALVKKQASDLLSEKENLTTELQSTRDRARSAESEKETLKETVWDLHTKVVALKQSEERLVTVEEELETERKHARELAADLRKAEASASKVAGDQGALATELSAARERLREVEEQRRRLEERVAALEETNEASKDRLSSQREQASKRLQELRNEFEAKEKKLRDESTSFKLEIDRLKAILLEAEKKEARQVADARTKLDDLEAEMAKLRSASEDSNLVIAELRAEKMALRKEIAENLRATKEAAIQTETTSNVFADGTTTTRTDTQPSHSSKASSHAVVDRLGRIRDVAERAALLQDYRREIAHHKDEHRAELKRLSDEHDDQMKEVMQEAKAEVHSRTREYRRRLKAQHQEELTELERRHQEDLSEIKKEFEKRVEVADELMQAAMSEVTETAKQLQVESEARESLEKTVHALEQQLEAEKRREPEIESRLRKEFREEANCLVDSIKQECNTVFDKSKKFTKSPSPRSVLVELPSMVQRQSKAENFFQPIQIETTSPEFEGSVCSDMDRVLDETEALVRSLMV